MAAAARGEDGACGNDWGMMNPIGAITCVNMSYECRRGLGDIVVEVRIVMEWDYGGVVCSSV
jgi:hypothetical protein